MKHHCVLVFICILLLSNFVWADNLPIDPTQFQPNYYNIHLTNKRICKKCTWRLTDAEHVELKNKKGVTGIYKTSEILGFDKHPFWRRFLIHSASNTWLAGETLVPSAVKEKYHKY